MKKLISALFIAGIFAAVIGAPLFADSAKVTYVKGKVEVQRGGSWIPLSVGDLVSQDETVSTGFQSEARLNLNGSILAVAALSRVKIETLTSTNAKDSVSLYVDTGAIRSKVTHSEGKKVDYTARTSVAVASVRGTDFSINARGNVRCTEGAVAVYAAKYYRNPSVSNNAAMDDEGESPEPEADNAPAPAPVAQGPASATTPANEISEKAPVGAVVVGAGQSTTITLSGAPAKPRTEATKTAEKAINTVSTASDKESVSTGKSAPASLNQPQSTTGEIEISIEIAD